MRASTAVALALLVIFWASAFPAIKVALEGLSPTHLTLARHLVASLAFLPFLLLFRARLWPDRRDLLPIMGLGAVGITTYHLALNIGQVYISAGATSLIIATAPAITALLAWWLHGEGLPLWGWIGSGLALAGVALIVLGDGALGSMHPAAGLVLLSALVTSLFALYQRPYLQRYRPLEFTAYATWGGTVPLLIFLPGLAADLSDAGTLPLLATLHLGVVPSAIAYTLFAVALQRAPAPFVTSFLYLIPVVALWLSWWWLAEVPSSLMLVGGAVAVVGLVLIQRSRSRLRALGQ
jgi:drug/metabolite transporter (DMT)-like permease